MRQFSSPAERGQFLSMVSLGKSLKGHPQPGETFADFPRMLSIILASMLGIVNQTGEASFQRNLAQVARDELQIIERIRSLRAATEKLPKTWKVSNVRSMPNGSVMTKEDLLREIESMELQAADRWSTLLENTARLDVDPARLASSDLQMRRALDDLPKVHAGLNQKLDQYNARLKDGILMNMANNFLSNPVAAEPAKRGAK